MSLFITQCPGCRTSFRIRQGQLEAADGFVRCGACMKVFDARGPGLRPLDEDGYTQQIGDFKVETPGGAASAYAPTGSAESPYRYDEARIGLETLEDLHDEAPAPEATGIHEKLAGLRDEDSLEALDREALASLDAGPLELTPPPVRPPRSRLEKALLGSASLLLILLLAGQATWFNRADLAEDPRLRPLLLTLCERLGCRLADLSNLAAITPRELVVRSHPSVRDALQVDFVFLNEAPYPQAFPLVELNFRDMAGRAVANRAFTPEEYLPEGLRGIAMMPSGQPVQVTLELADPGPEAVNYSLAFRLP